MHKNTLTLAQAESRLDWQKNWEEYSKYAGKVAWSYCGKRLRQYSLDQIREIRDEALSEAWRYVCDGETAERAIVKAVDCITKTAQKHLECARPLPELPAHTQEYIASEDRIRELVAELPEKLRAVAIVLSAEPDMPYSELADLLECSKATIVNRVKALREALSERYNVEPQHDFLYWLRTTFATA